MSRKSKIKVQTNEMQHVDVTVKGQNEHSEKHGKLPQYMFLFRLFGYSLTTYTSIKWQGGDMTR